MEVNQHCPHKQIDGCDRTGRRGLPAEVAADDAVPGGRVLLVEGLLDVGGNVLLDVELLHGFLGAVDGFLLHFVGHIGILYDGLSSGGVHGVAKEELVSVFFSTNALIYIPAQLMVCAKVRP